MTDYRAAQSPIVDQGSRGICAACAVTAAHEWCLRQPLSIEDAHWNGKQSDPWPADEGTSVGHILSALQNFGHALEKTWPLNAPPFPGPPPPASQLPASRMPTPDWQLLPYPTPAGVHTALAHQVVILSLKHVPHAWERGALVHADAGAGTITRHAVVAVGEARVEGHNTVIIRNSWGTDWGEDGFGYITDSYLEHYLVNAFTLNGLIKVEVAA